jgi:hypothetical protein
MPEVVGALLGGAAQITLGAAFLLAAVHKARAAAAFRHTVRQLGVPGPAAAYVAGLVTAGEFLTATMLFILPGWWLPRVAVCALAVAFAAAGAWAILTRRQVSCRCFGDTASPLGRRQILFLPVWSGLAVIGALQAPGWTAAEGLTLLSATACGLTVIHLPGLIRVLGKVRGDRLAIAPGYGRRPPDEQESAP